MKQYQEVIVCGKCKKKHYRNIEIFETTGKHLELDKPLNVIIIKKFECPDCKEDKNYSSEIKEVI